MGTNKIRIIKCIVLLVSTISFANAAETDTLTLNLSQTEELFIRNNFDLLLQQSQTDKAKAELITAKLFNNPELNYENLFYNHETKRFFETSFATGQYNAQVSQLIKLAGKRNKSIRVATSGIKLAEYEYFDLLRTLRFELRTTFFKVFYLQQSLKAYHQQVQALQQLLKATEQQYKAGNTASKDVLRIKSLLYKLQTEYNNLKDDLEDFQSDLKLLIYVDAGQHLNLILPEDDVKDDKINERSYIQLLDSAKVNRADIHLAQANIEYASANLKLQRAMAIPDVALSLSYDLKGNYPEKYTGIGISIPIPLFNRNQGEIKKAQLETDAGNLLLKKQELIVETEVYNSYQTALRAENLYNSFDPAFYAEFNKLIQEVNKNFNNRNISLLEFIDFYDSYKESILLMNNLKLNKATAKEEINYVTGTSIFK
jgi:cobalt-zinc-cadmium efflux system outer membrane protein